MTHDEPAGAAAARFGGQEPPAGVGALSGMRGHDLGVATVGLSLDPHAALSSPLGVVHGRIAATPLDSTMGCAVRTTLDEYETYTTASCT